MNSKESKSYLKFTFTQFTNLNIYSHYDAMEVAKPTPFSLEVIQADFFSSMVMSMKAFRNSLLMNYLSSYISRVAMSISSLMSADKKY
jgi:hypothetical protein